MDINCPKCNGKIGQLGSQCICTKCGSTINFKSHLPNMMEKFEQEVSKKLEHFFLNTSKENENITIKKP